MGVPFQFTTSDGIFVLNENAFMEPFFIFLNAVIPLMPKFGLNLLPKYGIKSIYFPFISVSFLLVYPNFAKKNL